MNDRPPVLDRWNVQAVVAALSIVQAVLASWSPRAGVGEGLPEPVRQWQAKRQADAERHPWRSRVARERAWLRAGVSVWVAWRSWDLERRTRL